MISLLKRLCWMGFDGTCKVSYIYIYIYKFSFKFSSRLWDETKVFTEEKSDFGIQGV